MVQHLFLRFCRNTAVAAMELCNGKKREKVLSREMSPKVEGHISFWGFEAVYTWKSKNAHTQMHEWFAKYIFFNNLLVFWHKAMKPKAKSLVSLKEIQSSIADQAVLLRGKIKQYFWEKRSSSTFEGKDQAVLLGGRSNSAFEGRDQAVLLRGEIKQYFWGERSSSTFDGRDQAVLLRGKSMQYFWGERYWK